MLLRLLGLLSLATFVSHLAFASTKYDTPNTEVQKEGVASMWTDWVKDKGSKYDVSFNLKNLCKTEGIIVMLGEMSCKRGNVAGTLKHTFFNTGEKTIDLRPGQTKSFNLVCQLNEKTKGIYSISSGKIYQNPGLDGKTTGKVLADNLEWSWIEKRD